MREIKFRAWDGIRMTASGIQINAANGVVFVAADMPIMQFTGLKDKNGKEIYEGDIANITIGLIEKGGYTERGVMEFNQQSAQFAFLCEDSLFEEPQERPDAFTIEVIGNIYENPELINGEGK